MPNDRPTLEEIRTVWRDVNIPAYALPKKDWFDRLDAAIRADERALVAASRAERGDEDTRDAERWRAFFKRANCGVTEDGDLWIGASDGPPEECAYLTDRQRDVLNGDIPSTQMQKNIVTRFVDAARSASRPEEPRNG